jgi:hypothetical protein
VLWLPIWQNHQTPVQGIIARFEEFPQNPLESPSFIFWHYFCNRWRYARFKKAASEQEQASGNAPVIYKVQRRSFDGSGNQKKRILMRIPNRLKPHGVITQINRLKPGGSFTLDHQVGISQRTMRSDGPRSKDGNKDKLKLRIQNFSYHAPAARSVQLVGDFTNWLEQPINLRKGPEGIWWKAVRLEIDTHYYRFLVDGQWRDDLDCALFVPNPFGSQNAVRQVL